MYYSQKKKYKKEMGKNKKFVYRISKTQKIILKIVAFAGVMSVAVVAPNVLQCLSLTGFKKFNYDDKKYSIDKSKERLITKGLLKYSKKGFVELTQKGQKELRKIELLDYKIKKPKKWDKKWRVLIFDIKETKRKARGQLRITLNSIGFIKLQNSVWVYPYDCEDLIKLLKTDFCFGKEVLYMVVEKIENQNILIKHFKL